MSLLREWHELARELTDGTPGDKYFAAETDDPRVSFSRRAVVGGVSDGRPEKRGVILVAVTSDGCVQELGASTPDHALAIVAALHDAWPEIASLAPLASLSDADLAEILRPEVVQRIHFVKATSGDAKRREIVERAFREARAWCEGGLDFDVKLERAETGGAS